MKKRGISLATIILLLLLINLSSSLSEEALQIEHDLDHLKLDIELLLSKEIPIDRINETYQETRVTFETQKELENLGRVANYDIIKSRIEEMQAIKKNAIDANDQLLIYQEIYEEANKEINLSEMQLIHRRIHNSFKEERFEETIRLIEEGYSKLSEVQASQTGASLFYKTASTNIRSFIEENWIKILIILGITLVSLAISWKALSKLRVELHLRHLKNKKSTINSLIKDLQKRYFKQNKASETEYKIKMKKFGEMIRDIDREIPLLREKMAKIEKKENLKEKHSNTKKTAKKDPSKPKKPVLKKPKNKPKKKLPKKTKKRR